MKLAFVIGNGKSRQGVELQQLKHRGTVYVCNQAVFDIPAHHVIAVDRSVAIHIASVGYALDTKLWTRHRWQQQLSHEREIYALPRELYKPISRWDRELNWGSGTHAVWQAATSHDVVVLIGFDLWSDQNRNNIYDDNLSPVNPEHWIHQLSETFRRHVTVQFVQTQPNDWNFPVQWCSHENLSRDTIDNVLALMGN